MFSTQTNCMQRCPSFLTSYLLLSKSTNSRTLVEHDGPPQGSQKSTKWNPFSAGLTHPTPSHPTFFGIHLTLLSSHLHPCFWNGFLLRVLKQTFCTHFSFLPRFDTSPSPSPSRWYPHPDICRRVRTILHSPVASFISDQNIQDPVFEIP